VGTMRHEATGVRAYGRTRWGRLAAAALFLCAGAPVRLSAQCPDGTPPPCARPAARTAAPAAPAATSVAVLYFDNLSRDTAYAYVADGLTEELIVRLGQVRRLDVKSRFEAQRVRGAAPDPRTMGRTLRAAYLVTGTLQMAGQRVRLSVSLVRTSNGAQVWGNVYDRTGSDLLQIQSDVATEVARAIAGQLLPDERASLARRPTSDPVAYDLYLRGISAANSLSEDGLRAGLSLLDRAIARDSAFAGAYAQKAFIWLMLSDSWIEGRDGYARVREAAERALRLDSTQALAWALLTWPAAVIDYDPVEAMRYAQRAVSLDSRVVVAQGAMETAYILAGRPDESVRVGRLGWQADTLAAVACLAYLNPLQLTRQLDTMEAVLPRMTLALAPEDLAAWEGWVRLLRGDAAGAAERLTWQYFGGWFGGERVRALALLGRREAAVATLDSMLTEHRRGYFNAYVIAKGYAALGDADSAFAWLERARDQRTHWLLFTPYDAMLDPLHADQRWAAFLRRTGGIR
jgi:TolB-like protein